MGADYIYAYVAIALYDRNADMCDQGSADFCQFKNNIEVACRNATVQRLYHWISLYHLTICNKSTLISQIKQNDAIKFQAVICQILFKIRFCRLQ